MILFLILLVIIAIIVVAIGCVFWALAKNIEEFSLGTDNEEPKEVDFKSYYKFPLKMWEGTTGKVFTDDNNMAFDWLLPYGKQFDFIKKSLLDRINGYDYTPWKIKKTFYKNDNGHIVCKLEEGENAGKETKILLVRGWGMLTGVGGYHLPVEEASKIQDEFTAYILRCLND